MSNLNDKNVGILCGGWSDEREVSLDSGKTAYKSLKGKMGNELHALTIITEEK